jgi:alanyl-tRNA synthetase
MVMQQLTYWDQPYLPELSSGILERRTIKKGPMVAPVDLLFHPSGGGQPDDTGSVAINGTEYECRGFRKIDGLFFILLPKEAQLPEASYMKQKIDMRRRLRLMRCHTAAHILMQAVSRFVTGYEPDGIDLKEDGDCSIYFGGQWKEKSSPDAAIRAATIVVREDRKVRTYVIDSLEKAIAEHGSIYRGPQSLRGPVRIVEVEGWDANPCGGTHVSMTGEIGEIICSDVRPRALCFRLTEEKAVC